MVWEVVLFKLHVHVHVVVCVCHKEHNTISQRSIFTYMYICALYMYTYMYMCLYM